MKTGLRLFVSVLVASGFLLIQSIALAETAVRSGEQTQSATAATKPADRRKLVEEVLERFGVNQQIAQIPTRIQAQLQQRRSELSPQIYAELSGILPDAFRTELLDARTIKNFEAKANKEQLLSALEWLRSPPSKKMTQLEVEVGTPEGQRQLREFVTTLQSNPPSEQRVALLLRLDEATEGTEMAIALTVIIARAMVEGMQPLLPPEKRMDHSQVERQIGTMKSRLHPMMKNYLLVANLFVYRSVSDDELEGYVSNWESENGQWLYRTTIEAFMAAMATAAKEAGERIAEVASQKSAEKQRKQS